MEKVGKLRLCKAILFFVLLPLVVPKGFGQEEECDNLCYLKTYDCLRDNAIREMENDCLGDDLKETLQCFDGMGGVPIQFKKQCLNDYDTCLQNCYDSKPN